MSGERPPSPPPNEHKALYNSGSNPLGSDCPGQKPGQRLSTSLTFSRLLIFFVFCFCFVYFFSAKNGNDFRGGAPALSSSGAGWPDLDGQTQKSPHFCESPKPEFLASIVLHFYIKKSTNLPQKRLKVSGNLCFFRCFSVLTLKIELGWSVPLQNE